MSKTNTTTTTAVELLAEWKREEQASNPFSTWPWHPERQKEVAAHLDKMCTDAGISLVKDPNEYAKLGKCYFAYTKILGSVKEGGAKGYDCLSVCAEEQQALQEWLLIRSRP